MFFDTISLITGEWKEHDTKFLYRCVFDILGKLNYAYVVDICDANVVAVATAGLEPAPNPSTLDSL